MRLHFFDREELPLKNEIIGRLANCNDKTLYCRFLDCFYQTIKLLSNTTGMQLFRLNFEEMRFIYHKHHLGITLEFTKNEKTN